MNCKLTILLKREKDIIGSMVKKIDKIKNENILTLKELDLI